MSRIIVYRKKMMLFFCMLKIASVQAAENNYYKDAIAHTDVQKNRQQIIDQAVRNFPEIEEGVTLLNSLDEKFIEFSDFLEKKLGTEDQEANFGELCVSITDEIVLQIADYFLDTLHNAIDWNKDSLDDTTSKSALYFTKYKDHDAVKYYIKKALDKPYNHKAPLLHKAIAKENSGMTHYMLGWNADANLLYKEWSPLAKACQNGNENIVKLLLAAGASIDNKDVTKNIPLFVAVENRHESIVALLLAAGADVNRYDGACNVLRRSIAHVKNVVDGTIHNPSLPITAMILAADNIDVNAICFGTTALHYAAKYNRIECIRMLLAARADGTILDSNGQTPEQVTTSPEIQHMLAQARRAIADQSINSCCAIS